MHSDPQDKEGHLCRRSARWTPLGARVLAALALVVAGMRRQQRAARAAAAEPRAGGGDQTVDGGQEGRDAERPLRRRRRPPRPGPARTTARLHGHRTPTQRPLYSFTPDNSTSRSPDLADGPAADLDGRQDGHGQDQARRSSTRPPVNRAVTSADVKYAIERGFNPNVANGYAGAYFLDIVGAPDKADSGGNRSPASRRPTRRRSSSSSTSRPAPRVAQALVAAAHGAGAGGVRGAVRAKQARRPTASTRSSPART